MLEFATLFADTSKMVLHALGEIIKENLKSTIVERASHEFTGLSDCNRRFYFS